MIAVAWFQLVTAMPSMLTSSSPGWSPAAAAGAAGSSGPHSVCSLEVVTHSETEPRVVVDCGIPKPHSRIVKSTIAMSRFMVGPPSMMMMRLPVESL